MSGARQPWTCGTKPGPENCGDGLNIMTVVDGEEHCIAWTTRVVVRGEEVVTGAEAGANAKLYAFAPELARVLAGLLDARLGGNIELNLRIHARALLREIGWRWSNEPGGGWR